MKKCKLLIALAITAVLAGCAAGKCAETVSDTTVLDASISETVVSEAPETAKSEAAQTTAEEKSEMTSQAAEQTTNASEATNPETAEELIETTDETETELTNEEDGAKLYHDKNTNEYFIMLNVTPRKVYWNEIDGYDVTVGQAMDIAVPAVFEDWLADADEMMIYIGADGWNTAADINADDRTVKGMYCRQYFDRDYLCPIKDGTVQFGEISDEINSFFSRISDGVYIEEANYQYSDNPFGDGMSVENLDTYFETVIADWVALKEEMAANPDTYYDIAGFWVHQDGVRFRATINYIY